MEFQNRKSAALAAINSPEPDKSPKGNVDVPIISLLSAINSHPSYFTTSSCSGRISILSQPTSNPTSKKKARGGSWLLVSHDPVDPSSLIPLLFSVSTMPNLVFRFEPLIIAVECHGVEAAQRLVSLAISCGFRESGITSVSKRVIVAIRCSIRLEVPLGDGEEVMVTREYVEYLVRVANEKMEANRKRTDLFFEKLLESGFPGGSVGESGNGDKLAGLAMDEVEVKEAELGYEKELNRVTDNGSMEDFCINLSLFKVVGEPVESLFFWGHSACTLHQKKVIVFGGFGGTGRHARRNDLLLVDKESGVVEKIVSVGAPSPRLGHTSSLVGDSMYVIGGRADPLNILNDVWVFNVPKKEWKLLQCSGSLFPPRHRHTAAVVGSKIYVFGGIRDDAVVSSLCVLDTDTSQWTEIDIQGDHPGPRHSHSMEANGSKLYMFGGYNGKKQVIEDLHMFDTKTCLCTKLKRNGTPPKSRFSHVMFSYSNYLGILGGCPLSEHRRLFLFDLKSECWSKIMLSFGEESLFVRSTGSVVGDDLIIIGGGAACYAFGTKFTEPMTINLLRLTSLCYDTITAASEEKLTDLQEGNGPLLNSRDRDEQKVYHDGQDSEQKPNGCPVPQSEGSRLNNSDLAVASPCVLRLGKKYAKLGKDILKQFGWLDLERKVYIQDNGTLVCFPITQAFGIMFENKQQLGDKSEVPQNLMDLKPPCWQNMLKDMSHKAALDLLVACGANMIVDKIIKVKKTHITPFEVMKEAVAAVLKNHGLSLDLLEQLPSRWERLGDIIVLPVLSFSDPAWDSVGEHIWPAVAQSLGTERLARQGWIAQSGTRDSKLEILVGDNGWVNHRENGIIYSFDTTKCMFSWGNLSEKLRIGRLECREEVVVDLFAGIGYFTLPLLVRAGAKLVYACEWNPHAIEALHHNLHANNVADRCIVLEGDNRVTAPKGVADRVSLGLIPSSECSWTTAVRALRDEGGILHIHGNAKDTEEVVWVNHVTQSISDIARSEGRAWEVSVEHVERVKWYAPHIRHLVIDMRCKLSEG